MKLQKQKLAMLIATSLLASTAFAATQIALHPSISLSTKTGAPDAENAANKGKIVRLKDGTLISVYGDAVNVNFKSWNYSGVVYSARDVFVTWSKDDGVTWADSVECF